MTHQDPIQSQTAFDIMAQLRDPQWALEAAQLEDDANCTISAGRDFGKQLGQFITEPERFHQYLRIRTLVLDELCQLLKDCDLGAGLSAAQVIGQKLLLQRLKHPSDEIQTQLKTLLTEDLAKDSIDVPLSETAQVTLQQVIRTVLTPTDWEAISSAATTAIQNHIRDTLALPQTA
jgi:hypothetical protein